MEKQEIEALLDGLEEKKTFMHHSFNERVETERDRCVMRLKVRPEVCNIYDKVHGGAICTLADNAAGAAAHTDGRMYVTQSCTFNMLANQGEGEVFAEAVVLHRGRSTAVVEVQVTGTAGKLLAKATFTMFCLGEWKKN